METPNKTRLKELDSLRGIAALMVVLFHFTMGREEYNTVFKYGTTGVDLFFIISGFVIFMSIQKVSKGIDFVTNRISRLYPTYWASVTFTFLLITVFSVYKGSFPISGSLTEFIGNLTMFQHYLEIPDLDGPYWTMIIEMIFYIVILLLFELKILKYINIIGILACLYLLLLLFSIKNPDIINTHFYWVPLLEFFPLFFAGIIFYKLYNSRTNLATNYSILFFCLICQILLFPYIGKSRGYINMTEYTFVLLFYFLLFILLVNSKLNFVINRYTIFLGRISFPLYLTHQYLSLGWIIPLFYKNLGLNFWFVTVFINLPIVIAIATFITYKIEIPYSKKMKNSLIRITTTAYKIMNQPKNI